MSERLRSGDAATDVLAAEEFGVPAPDPALHSEQLVLPADLVGEKPRDVLAAEEFAMPAPDEARVPPRDRTHGPPLARLVALNLPPVLLALLLWRRWLRRRHPGA